MATFRHVRTEWQCADEEVNRRILWLDPGNPGWVYAYRAPDDAVGAADQFSRYGILEEMELPGPGDDRISAVTFEMRSGGDESKRCWTAVSAIRRKR
jgi:hypothetical protein